MDRTYDDLVNERKNLITNKTHSYQKTFKMCPPKVENVFSKNAIKGIHTKNLLNQVYFSEANIKRIQNLIRYNVYKLSKKEFKIGLQDKTQLQIVMRSIYFQYGRNLDTNISEQIKQLNNIVTNKIVPKIISNIKQYVKYLKDISEPYYIMERPKNMNVTGLKSVRLDTALGFGDEKK